MKAASSARWTAPRNSCAATRSPACSSSSSTSSAASLSGWARRGPGSAVPALIVSTAAGWLVSKAGVSGAADKALMKQLSGYPQALGMSAGVMLVLALLPGIPMIPFLLLGGGAAALAWTSRQRNRATRAAEAVAAAAPAAAAAASAAAEEEPISAALKIDD